MIDFNKEKRTDGAKFSPFKRRHPIPAKGGVLGALLIALGLTMGGFFPGYYYYQAKTNHNTVSVKGLAEKDVVSDLAVWDLKFVTTGNDLGKSQAEMTHQANLINNFLLAQGFTAEEIESGRLETNDLMANPWRGNDVISSRFILNQTITVRSNKVNLVAESLTKISELIAQGIVFDSQNGYPVSYIFTKLNEIKPQMLEEATKNAREAAIEFAKSSNSKVGKIHTANQGVFSILPRDDTANAVASQQINKKVRVVSTVEYFLE
ncbi:MAG: SIMPL domain-containing protein [Alphaproteobacteria bacterium]|nr:SIMPL domain-containing protein [Alphaproteobacteria bacterium]